MSIVPAHNSKDDQKDHSVHKPYHTRKRKAHPLKVRLQRVVPPFKQVSCQEGSIGNDKEQKGARVHDPCKAPVGPSLLHHTANKNVDHKHDGEDDEQVDRPDHNLEVGICNEEGFVEAKVVMTMV